jgi:molybdenum cofactor cytidylyltransferase
MTDDTQPQPTGSDGLPLVDGSDLDPEAGPRSDARVAGVLLAAGLSTRFENGNKLLAEVGGRPVVYNAAATLVEGLDAVTVVVGHEAEAVRAALEGLDVAFTVNEAYADGQAASVRAGVEAVREDADAVLVALGDMPFVLPRSVRMLVEAYRAGEGTALAAAYKGQRGNPALFDAEHLDALTGAEGDTGGRELLLSEGVLVETGDPGVTTDIDSREDLEAFES